MATDNQSFRRPENIVSRSGKRKGKRSGRVIFSIFFTLVVIAGALYATMHFLTAPDQFVVKTLVINDVQYANAAVIRNVVEQYCQGNILTADLDVLCRYLEGEPWIHRVTAQRILPDTLQLDVEESVPEALVHVGQSFYLIDSEGDTIDSVKPGYPTDGLPIVTGGDAIENADRRDRFQAAVTMLARVRLFRHQWYDRISEVHLDSQDYVTVYLSGAKAPILVNPEHAVSHLTKYFMIEAELEERYDSAERFDARFARRIFVKKTNENFVE